MSSPRRPRSRSPGRTRKASSSSARSRSTTITCSPSRTRSRTTRRKPLSVYPYAAVVQQGTPRVAGYYVLFEGLLGYIGDTGLQEWTYAKLDKEGVKSYSGTGGFVGITTDKYWAAAVIPDQTKAYDARFIATDDGRQGLSGGFARGRARRRSRSERVDHRGSSSPAPRWCSSSIITSSSSASRAST